MDSNTQQHREIVFCHSCENEWYRHEHGLICPECHSDFTEIVEENNDPRQDEPQPQPQPQQQTPHANGDFYAPDPDEADIDNLRWEQTGPDRYRVRGTYRTDIPLGPGQQLPQGQGGVAGGLMGLVGNALQGIIGNAQGQGGQQQEQSDQNTPGRPASAPGSPPPDGQAQPRGNGGTFVRHGHGPGFSYTIATSSNSNFGPGLFPRNANGPQPFQNQPDNIEQMIQQMMMNVGVPGGPFGGGMRAGPGGHPFHEHDMHPGFGGGPFMVGGAPGGMGDMGPFANLFQLFGPPGGVAGDAVYTQEALDRIMTQLMEQHQAGNAPGPASEAAIQALPKRVISKEDQGDSGKAECSICMDEVDLGGTVTVLPCSHWFHHECVKAWLAEHDTCPHCRQGIMPKEGGDLPRAPSQAPLNDMHSPQATRPAGPFSAPDSPNESRQRTGSSGGGMFSRMRSAFGGSSTNNGSGGGNDGRG